MLSLRSLPWLAGQRHKDKMRKTVNVRPAKEKTHVTVRQRAACCDSRVRSGTSRVMVEGRHQCFLFLMCSGLHDLHGSKCASRTWGRWTLSIRLSCFPGFGPQAVWRVKSPGASSLHSPGGQSTCHDHCPILPTGTCHSHLPSASLGQAHWPPAFLGGQEEVTRGQQVIGSTSESFPRLSQKPSMSGHAGVFLTRPPGFSGSGPGSLPALPLTLPTPPPRRHQSCLSLE